MRMLSNVLRDLKVLNQIIWVPRSSRLFLYGIDVPFDFSPHWLAVIAFMIQKKCFVLMWVSATESGDTFRTICDNTSLSVDQISSTNARKNLRKALHRTKCRPISWDVISARGYQVYKAACSRYDNTSEMSQVEYFSLMKHLKSFNNACVFGAFVDEDLVAYIIAIPSGDRLFGYFGCFDPKYSNSYPMWSLYFNICKFAFLEGFSVFDRGVQPLKHTTNIDEFLLRIGYRMESCRSIYYAMPLLSFGFWFVSLLEIFGIKSFLGILLSDIKIIKKVINNE